MSDYDSPWKEALDDYFERFMAFFFPHVHAEIDWTRGYETLDKELQQIAPEAEVGRRLVDKLVKVWRKNGAEEWVLIHIEVQSQPETVFPQRMYVYNYRLFDRYNRKVVSLAILADDRPSWRPDHFEYSLWGCKVGIQFPVIKLLDYAVACDALESDPNPFAMVVLAHLKTLETRRDPANRLNWKVRLIKGLYERGLSPEDVRKLFRFIDWVMELPQALEDFLFDELRKFEEAKQMPFVTTPERVGHRRGLREGLLRGLEAMLKIKFGQEGLQIMPELRELTEVEKLEQLVDAIPTVTTLEELRQVWAKVNQSENGQSGIAEAR
jgi:hypothetical protein